MDASYVGYPMLSVHDPEGSGSTSLDPLGLTPLGEQLAVELIPGVRERQTHPRYLTTIAVSHAVCQEFPSDTVAADGFSEPWQVFEWYVVEGLVRGSASSEEARVPGSLKAKKALSQGLHLNAARYLKAPGTFGFHGVYGLLARTLRVEQADHLAEFGFELLEAWQNERDLAGFYGTSEGPGRNIRQRLTEAVRAGLKAGAVDCSGSWFGWKFFHEHLNPTESGPRERQLLWNRIRTGTSPYCAEALDFLVSKAGKELMNQGANERRLYATLKRVVSKNFQARIEVIQRYEAFCRILQNAFDSCRYEITQARRGIKPVILAELPAVKKAVEFLPSAFNEAEQSLGDSQRRLRFKSVFEEIAQTRQGPAFVQALFEHHKRVQKAKPPDGKATWIEQHFDGSLLIRPEYQLKALPELSGEFVNPYRMRALWNFAVDLKQV